MYLVKYAQDYCEMLTKKNREFLQESVEERFGPKIVSHGVETYDIESPLAAESFVRGQWNIKSQRCGLIGRKIGVQPLWTKTGQRLVVTLIQVKKKINLELFILCVLNTIQILKSSLPVSIFNWRILRQ